MSLIRQRAGWVYTQRFLLFIILTGIILASGCAAGSPPALDTGLPEEVGLDPAVLEPAVENYRIQVEEDLLRGALLLVARHGKVVLQETIGWADMKGEIPLEPDAQFRMASNTKTVVATAALILVEEGKLALDDPVGKYLPAFSGGPSSGVTIQHLLTHTSGFMGPTDFWEDPIFMEPLLEESTLQAEVNRLAAAGPPLAPGSAAIYSNQGYNILGAVIEVIAGQPLEEFLQTRIYEPLGMNESLHRECDAGQSRLPNVYRRSGGEWALVSTPVDNIDLPFVWASGGMISTARDFSVFMQMWLNGGSVGDVLILEPETVELATSPLSREIYPPEQLTNQESLYDFGYGWFVYSDGIVSHSGAFGTYAWLDPEYDIFGLVLTQNPGGNNPSHDFAREVRLAVTD